MSSFGVCKSILCQIVLAYCLLIGFIRRVEIERVGTSMFVSRTFEHPNDAALVGWLPHFVKRSSSVLTRTMMNFVCGADGGLCCNVLFFRHSPKRDKGKQKRAKKPPKQPANMNGNDNIRIPEIADRGQPTFRKSGDEVKTGDVVLLQVFRRKSRFTIHVSEFYLLLACT